MWKVIALLLAPAMLSAAAPPRLPVYDWGACPFEGCVYREWTARQPVTVYDTFKVARKPIARVAAGEKVKALRGVVITFRPGTIRLDRDVPEQHLKRGDTILTYAYRGEGTSAAWVNGQFYKDFDISITKWPDGQGCGNAHCAATYLELGRKQWWAEVKLRSGKTGFVWMDHAQFDGAGLIN